MSYSDDGSPSPSIGGEGDIFAGTDLISGSPTTCERVVDTQSGYLVVVKKMESGRASLSVKRRLGTPPSSSIVLTPDEQIKLAKILAEAKNSGLVKTRLSPRAQAWTNSLSSKTREGEQEFTGSDAPEKEFARVFAERKLDKAIAKIGRSRQATFNRAQITALIVVFVGVPTAIICGVGSLAGKDKHTAQAPPAAVAAPKEDEKLDRFVREFVADMLDFRPATYKLSQIRAMSAMTPQLLESYWSETHFPLTRAQLLSTPRGQTLMITKVSQKPCADGTSHVDLFAELVSANSKVSTPVHLLLKVEATPSAQFQVIEQKDLSGK